MKINKLLKVLVKQPLMKEVKYIFYTLIGNTITVIFDKYLS